MARHGSIKENWQERFLQIYEESCNITTAARAVQIGRRTVYREKARNPDFAAKMAAAEEVAVSHLEEVAYQRATESSDTLLIFLLKANRPAKYRERIDVKHGGSVNHNHRIEEGLDEEIEGFLAANDADRESDDGGGDPRPALEAGSPPGPAAA